jgi:hypothetical protein
MVLGVVVARRLCRRSTPVRNGDGLMFQVTDYCRFYGNPSAMS